jgi:hypothetical protein
MDTAQLADEQRKHQRTIQKFSGAHWVAEICARLRLVAEELRRRQAKSPPRQAKSPPRSTVPAAAQISIFDVLGEITLRRSPGSVGIAQARAAS